MNKEELIAFLKENIRVWVACNNDGKVTVALELCGEEIARDTDYIDLSSAM